VERLAGRSIMPRFHAGYSRTLAFAVLAAMTIGR